MGVSRNANKEEIKKAYRLYASKFHPDRQDGDPFFGERFKDIKQAYDVLNDDEARRRYDNSLFSMGDENSSSNRELKEKLQTKISNLERRLDEWRKTQDEIKKKIENDAIDWEIEKKKKLEQDTFAWEREKEEKKAKELIKLRFEFDERENTIYLNTTQDRVTGNYVKISDKRIELQNVTSAETIATPIKWIRNIGCLFCFFGGAFLIFVVGIIPLIIGFILLYLHFNYSIKIVFQNNSSKIIETPYRGRRVKRIVNAINEAIQTNKAKYSNIPTYNALKK